MPVETVRLLPDVDTMSLLAVTVCLNSYIDIPLVYGFGLEPRAPSW